MGSSQAQAIIGTIKIKKKDSPIFIFYIFHKSIKIPEGQLEQQLGYHLSSCFTLFSTLLLSSSRFDC